MKPVLSIVIITHNNKKLLLPCLESVFAEKKQTQLNLEVIVVFNACTDDSAETSKKQFPEVINIDNPLNEGFSRANNHGIKKANGTYVMLLNDDTLVKPGALKTMVSFLQENSKAGMVGPKLLNPDGSLQVWGSKLSAYQYRTNQTKKINYLCFAAVMFQEKILEKVGLLDENYFFYNEELDFITRLKRAGYQSYYLPSAEIIHFGGQVTKKRRYDFELEGIKGTFYFIAKFYSLFYPIYRILFASTTLALCPLIILFNLKNIEKRKFYKDIFILAFTWSKRKYQARKYF